MLKVTKSKITGVISFLILCALIMLPVSSAFSQVPLDQQFIDAAQDLAPDAQLEFLELIRDPGQWEETFEELGIAPELADQIEERLNRWNNGHKQDQVFKKIEIIDDKITRKLANITDSQIIKADKILEQAAKEADKLATKTDEADAKAAVNEEKALTKEEEEAAKAAAKAKKNK